MAVTATVEKIPKGEPDVTKLNGFTGYMVTVTRYLQPRGGVGTTLVPSTRMTSLSEVLGLVTSVPLTGGPGFYKFTVADAGGTGEDVWMTKLGNGDVPQEGPMAVGPTGNAGAPDNVSPGVRHLGRGFYYDDQTQLLTTPWSAIVNWKSGDPLPEDPRQNQPRLSVVPPNATPWPGQQWPGQQWPGYPIPMDVSESKETTLLKEQLREMKADAERKSAEQERQRDMDKLREEMRRAQEETASTIKSLVNTLKEALAPKGPSDTERELAETRRRMEENERKMEQQRRDDQHRLDLREMNDKLERTLAAATANKTDPMLPILMQLLTQTQNSAGESVKAIQAATQASALAGERAMQQIMAVLSQNNMTPLQMIQMMTSLKGDANESTKILVESLRSAMDIQKEAVNFLKDAVGQPDQPWYVGVIQQGLDRASAVAASIAESRAQQQQIPTPQPQMVRRVAQPQQIPMSQQPVQLASAPPAAVPNPNRPGVTSTPSRPEGAVLDEVAGVWTLRDGRKIAHSDVQMNGWGVALARPPGTGPAPVPATPGAPGAVAPAAAPGASVAPEQPATLEGSGFVEQEDAVTVTPITKAKNKRGGKNGKNKAAPPPPPPSASPPYSLDQLREVDPEELHAYMEPISDENLFGPLLLTYVHQLRATNPLPAPAEVAQMVLQAQQRIQGFGGAVPPAMDLLVAEQLEVLVDRLLPDAPEEYQDAVIEAIGNALESTLDEGEDEPAGA